MNYPRTMAPQQADRRAVADYLTQLGLLWGVEGLAERSQVVFSQRMTRNFGRCSVADGRLVVAARLRDAPAETLREVIAHEAAHLVVGLRHGDGVRPHGPAWAHLMRQAGLPPRRTVPPLADDPPARDVQRQAAFEHRCPVCHARRLARRPVPRWRCAACVAAGDSGVMMITRRDAGS